MKIAEIIRKLHQAAKPKNVAGMARFGIASKNTLGVSIPTLRSMAKEIGKDHVLALALWQSGIHEARILASMVDEVEKVTEKQMDMWVSDFDSWDVCDQVCMNLFAKLPKRSPPEAPPKAGRRRNRTPDPYDKVKDWVGDDREFVRRAGFALISCLAWHDKKAPDSKFIGLFPLMKHYATDNRNFVRKAVNWALRQVGKRNRNLCQKALAVAHEIEKINTPSAHWIARDAIRELEKKFPEKQ